MILRVDRADGFVGRNFLVRGALEHGIYIEETDGYLLDRVKFFWAADYGNLTFTSDHGLYKNCDGFGSGDSVVYPGAAPETGAQADKYFYPDAPRFNTVVKKCDMRGSALAYSGSMGNAVRITKNHIYGNGTGLSTDTISASGHPGFPADSVEIDHNYIYSNNLNLFTATTRRVEPVVGVPVGVGVIWPGINNGARPRQLDLRQLALRDDAALDPRRRRRPTPEGSVDPGSPARPRPASRPRATTTTTTTTWARRPPDFTKRAWNGLALRRRRTETSPTLAAQRRRLLVGRVPGQHRQLLVRQHRHRRDRGERHRPRRRLAARGPAL